MNSVKTLDKPNIWAWLYLMGWPVASYTTPSQIPVYRRAVHLGEQTLHLLLMVDSTPHKQSTASGTHATGLSSPLHVATAGPHIVSTSHQTFCNISRNNTRETKTRLWNAFIIVYHFTKNMKEVSGSWLKYHYVGVITQLTVCKIWGFHGGDYEECLFWDIKTQFILHRRHIISLLQSTAS
jgi:hypothetical protein